MHRFTQALVAGAVACTGLVAASPAAPAATGTWSVLLTYGSPGWSYLDVPWNAYPGFFTHTFDASSWLIGQEGFGTVPGQCSWNVAGTVNTPWAVDTDMLVRYVLPLPSQVKAVRVQGTIDNDATIYMNGKMLSPTIHSGSCQAGAIDVTASAKTLRAGKLNLLAIRGHDYGGSTYLNVQVSIEVSP